MVLFVSARTNHDNGGSTIAGTIIISVAPAGARRPRVYCEIFLASIQLWTRSLSLRGARVLL
jgi:hypothetical protein